MKLKKLFLSLLIGLAPLNAYSISETDCIEDLSPGVRKTYTCEGQTYNLSVSKKCAEQGGCGLIIDVHGLTMDAYLQDQNTGLSVSGPANDFIVLQPFAPRKDWNESHYPKVYDFYRQLREAFDVDENRLHMTGFSQGSMMTLWFMCEYRDEFASYAPTAAASSAVCTDVEDGIPDLPIMYQHGWYDARADWKDAESFYKKVTTDREYKMTLDIGDRYSHRTEWLSPKGNKFVFLSHGYTTSYLWGAGHCMPGAPYRNVYSCRGNHSYSWGAEVLRFFIENPKQVDPD